MEGGGTLTVATKLHIRVLKQNRRKNDIKTDPDEIPVIQRNFIRIKFADTGTGIKEEDMVKLFDPFFTTKPEDQGTGLGLSVCYTIIEKHAGSIEVESKYGEGATFYIDLPCISRREDDQQTTRDIPQHSSK